MNIYANMFRVLCLQCRAYTTIKQSCTFVELGQQRLL